MSDNENSRWVNKYRPNTLEKVVGQDAAISLIKGAFKRKAFGDTILLSGPSGNGKTTLARIIAAMLSGYDGKILKNNPDLVESNTGADRTIEHIRKSIEQSRYSPRGGKRRVMVFDEAHALLGPSLSAILKELEEPAPKTTWILCTDQPHKLPNTILGRAQNIKLKAAEPNDVAPLLERILKREEIDLRGKNKSVALAVAKAAYGQPRLSIQLLEDTVNAFVGGAKIADALEAAIQSTPAAAGFDAAARFIKACLDYEELEAVKAIATSDSPDGVLIMANQMLEGMIRRAAGLMPNSGIGWATKAIPSKASMLPDLLHLQARFVAALDIAGRYQVPPASILYGLARKTK